MYISEQQPAIGLYEFVYVKEIKRNYEHLIEIRFSASGGKRLEEITNGRVGQKILIVFDGRVYSAPVVTDKVSGGVVQLSGLDAEEIKQLLDVLTK